MAKVDIANSALESAFPGIGNNGSKDFVVNVPQYSISNAAVMPNVDIAVGAIPADSGDFAQIQAILAPLTSKSAVVDMAQLVYTTGSDRFTFRFYISGGLLRLVYSWFTSVGAHNSTALTISVRAFFYAPLF